MKKISITLVMLFMLSALQAQEIFTLGQLLDSVALRHPSLQTFDLEAQAMDEAAKGARSWMPPQIAVGTFMTPYQIPMWSANGMNSGMGSLMFSVQQMIPKSGLLKAKSNYMQSMSKVVRSNKNVQLNEILNDAKLLFFKWLISERKLKILNKNTQILNRMLEIATARYGNNATEIAEFYKIKATLAQIKNEDLVLLNNIKSAQNQLNTMMNRSVSMPFDIDTNVNIKVGHFQQVDSALLYARKSEFKVLNQQMELNQWQTKIEKQSLKPEFGFSIGHMQTLGKQPLLFSAMLMINLPSVSWANKMYKANIQKLRYENDAILAQKQSLYNLYSGQMYDVQNDIKLKNSQLEIYQKELLPALQKSLETTQLAYAQNTANLSSVFQTWTQLNDAQLMYFQLMQEAFDVQVAYERLLEEK